MASRISSISQARFPSDKDVVLVNDFRYRKGRVSAKTGKRGKRRMTIEFQSEVVACDYSAHNLLRGPADKLTEMVKGDFGKISKQASPATMKRRKVADKAYKAGKPWALRAYRKGSKAKAARGPDPGSTTWGVDSGLLRDSVRSAWVEVRKSWTINVAGNRMHPTPFRNHAAFTTFLTELRKQVPSLNPRSLNSRREWKDSLRTAVDSAVINLADRGRDLRKQRFKTQLGIVRNILSLVA